MSKDLVNDLVPVTQVALEVVVIPKTEVTPVIEIGGREGPEPTRFGDWELRGRCIDF